MPIFPLSASVPPAVNDARGGLNLLFPDAEQELLASPCWSLAGWALQFVWLPPATRVERPASPGQFFAKVITGQLIEPHQRAFRAPFSIQSTCVRTPSISTGAQGALLALFHETSTAPPTLSGMHQIAFAGILSEALAFQTFEQRFGTFTDAFNGMDASMSPGIHLLDASGTEICNVIFWTAGKGVDLSTHNHGQTPSPGSPSFAEVHWVFRNGTGAGGMYLADAQDTPAHTRYPMQSGDEHGPFFYIDAARGKPRMRPNGAVDYPWHGWCAGNDPRPGQAYDLVCAFETNPGYADLSTS